MDSPDAANGPEALANTPLMQGLGLRRFVGTDRTADRPGSATLEFAVDERHCHAVAQGGYVTAWLDSAMARAVGVATDGQLGCNTLEIKVAFYRPALRGQVVTAIGWVERLGRSTAFLEAILKNDDGEVLAKASSTAKLANFKTQG